VKRNWTDEELTAHWSLTAAELACLPNRVDANRLGFALMPRLKAIAAQKLYRPVTGRPNDYPNLAPILTRPIRWELIRQQYDEMVKYATALRLGTADAETILKRFTRD
jgi:TnpA family transposase